MKINKMVAAFTAASVLAMGLVAVAAPANATGGHNPPEVCVPADAWTETVIVTPAIPAVPGKPAIPAIPAVPEIPEVSHFEYQRYSWVGGPLTGTPPNGAPGAGWQANTTNYEGAGHGTDPIGVSFDVSHGSSGNADWFFWTKTKVVDQAYVPGVPAVPGVDAVPEIPAVPAVTKEVRHEAVTCPPGEPEVAVFSTPTLVDLCGILEDKVTFGEVVGGSFKIGSVTDMGDGTTRFRVVFTPAEGYVLPETGSWDRIVDGKAVWLLYADRTQECETETLPPVINVAVDCDAEGPFNVFSTATNPNDETVEVTLAVDVIPGGDPEFVEVLPVDPGESTKGYTFGEDTTLGVKVLFEGAVIFDEVITVDCDSDVVTYPVPAQFSAEPTPASCDAAGAFDTAFLGEPVEGNYYEFENVWVKVDRSVEGQVYLLVSAKDGYTLSDLDPAKWNISEDGRQAERVITIPAQLSADDEECLVDVPEKPADRVVVTEEEEVDCESTSVITTTTTTTYPTTLVDNEWVEGEGVVVVTSDERGASVAECPIVIPPVAGPGAPVPAPATAGLAMTGGTDLGPWALGGIATLLVGASLMLFRSARLIRG